MLYRYVSWSWQLTEPSFFTMCTLSPSFLWLLMKIQFSLLISSSSLSILTSLRQESSLCCSVWTFCLYNFVSCQIRWELISHHTSMQSWFKVRVCWFLLVVPTVRHMVWHSFWNVVVHQNISVSVVITASDVTTHVAVLYATITFSLSSQMMRTTTMMSIRMSLLLGQEELHQHCCQWGQSSFMSPLKYVQLFFLHCAVLV